MRDILEILGVFITLALILLLGLLNRVCLIVIRKKKYSIKVKIVSVAVLIIVNIIIMYGMNGVLGKVMFLIPLILFGPSCTLFFNRKDDR